MQKTPCTLPAARGKICTSQEHYNTRHQGVKHRRTQRTLTHIYVSTADGRTTAKALDRDAAA